MAKRKKSSEEQAIAVDQPNADASLKPSEEIAGRFIGQWNRLVSTTNWEKGRIICQWREALELSAAPVTAYSDEAWAQLVGGVTSQHVGRLRRVFQRFGAVFDQYEGLYWSHFQASLDWDDAEMWLEGSILNHWSVSQMRGKRWETLGNAGDPPPELAIAETGDEAPFDEAAPSDGMAASAPMSPGEPPSKPSRGNSTSRTSDADAETDEFRPSAEAAVHDEAPAPSRAKTRKPLSVDVDELPSDLADAFEQFKLAIIAQRRTAWRETTPAAVIECLDALRELTLAPADD